MPINKPAKAGVRANGASVCNKQRTLLFCMGIGIGDALTGAWVELCQILGWWFKSVAVAMESNLEASNRRSTVVKFEKLCQVFNIFWLTTGLA